MRRSSSVALLLVGAFALTLLSVHTSSVARAGELDRPGGGQIPQWVPAVVLTDNPSGYPAGLLDLGLPGETGDPAIDAWVWLDELSRHFGIQDARSELRLEEMTALSGESGTLLRFGQWVGEIPVYQGEVVLTVDREGRLDDAINSYIALDRPIGEAQSEAPYLTAEQALELALDDGGDLFAEIDLASASQVTRLVYVAPLGSFPRLAWEVHPPGAHLALNYRFFYDATDGRRLLAFNDIRFDNLASVYTPNPGADDDLEPSQRELRDRDDPDGYLTGPVVKAQNCIDQGVTVTGWNDREYAICSEVQVAQADEEGNFFYEPDPLDPEDLFAEAQMYYHTAEIYHYFQQLGLETLITVPLPATVNFRVPSRHGDSTEPLAPYDNAFFMPAGEVIGGVDRPGDSLVFGQGTYVDFSYDGDVIYHEFSHAVFEAITSTGSFSFDEWGLTAAPGAVNEGQADYFAASFTGDSEIGEYVGPRIDPDYPADNIRNLDTDAACPTSITGESHDDSMHFSAALWDIRTAWVDEMEGDPVAFDSAIFDSLRRFGALVTFDQAAAIIQNQLEALDAELRDTVESAWAEHGVADCQRFVDIGPEQTEEVGYSYLYGTDAIGLDPFVPGFIQFRVHVDAQYPPLDTIEVSFDYAGGGGWGGGPATPEFLISFDNPVRLSTRFNEVTGAWIDQVDAEALTVDRERWRARYQVEGGLTPGNYYFLPIGTSGIDALIARVTAQVRSELVYEELEPDTVEEEPDVLEEEPDAGPDLTLPEVAELDGGAQPNSLVSGTENGCGCSASPAGHPTATLWMTLPALLVVRRRQRR